MNKSCEKRLFRITAKAKWYLYIDVNVDNNIDSIIDIIDINVDTNNDIDDIDSDTKSIDIPNYEKSSKICFFDENVFWFTMDRNNMLMNSYFACTHDFDAIFWNLLSEFTNILL